MGEEKKAVPQIRAAILGQGRSGRDIHGAHLSRDAERYRIVAVVDALEERRARAEAEYGPRDVRGPPAAVGAERRGPGGQRRAEQVPRAADAAVPGGRVQRAVR